MSSIKARLSKIRLKSPGMRKLLNDDPVLVRAVRKRAENTAAYARASAPVATGAYRDSIRVDVDSTDRFRARVIADVEHAMVVEADHGTLARALGAAESR